MTGGGAVEPTPAAALAMMVTEYEQLLKLLNAGCAESFDDHGSVEFMQNFEQFRNRLALVDHLMIADWLRRDLPTTLCQGTLRRVLTSGLGISRVEAARRVRAAEVVGPRMSMLGEALEPIRPVLGPLSRAGR